VNLMSELEQVGRKRKTGVYKYKINKISSISFTEEGSAACSRPCAFCDIKKCSI